jgi:glycine cleavage system H protein
VADDLKYTAEHEWISVVGSGDDAVLRVGITSYAQQALGDIVFVTLPAVGTTVTSGQSLGEVESTKSVSDVYAPVAGTVTARNEELDAHRSSSTATPRVTAGWWRSVRRTGWTQPSRALPCWTPRRTKRSPLGDPVGPALRRPSPHAQVEVDHTASVEIRLTLGLAPG